MIRLLLTSALAILAVSWLSAQEHPNVRHMERAHPTPVVRANTLPLVPMLVVPSTPGLFTNTNLITEEQDQLPAQNESSIAINPTNPRNLIGSAVDYRGNSSTWAYYSRDGGLTWQNVSLGRARPGWSSTNDPSVCFDRSGTGYLCYGGFNRTSNAQFGENGIFVSKTSDGGQTWNPQHVAVIIHTGPQTADSAFEDKYYIHVDTASTSPYVNHLYIPWKRVINSDSSTQIVIAKSTDGGLTWRAPVPVSDRFSRTSEDTTFGQSFPLARTGPDGIVHVVWNSGTERAVRYARSTNGGASFSAPQIVHRYQSFGRKSEVAGQVNSRVKGVVRAEAYPTLVVDNTSGPRRGWLYLVWSADTVPNVYFSRSTDNGTTWSAPTIVHSDTTNDQFWPWLALDPTNGDLAVMYFDSRDDAANILVNVYVSFSADGGTTWTDRRVGDGENDLRRNPFNGQTFAGDYSGADFLDGMVHPSWVDMRNSISNVADNDVYSARVNVRAPAAPVPFRARTLPDTVTAIRLTWDAVRSRSFGQPLRPDEVSLIISRNGQTIATLPGTATTYRDEGIQPYTRYTYSIVAATNRDTSSRLTSSAWSGGSPQPAAPVLRAVRGLATGELELDVTMPRLRADGENPLVNLAGVRIRANTFDTAIDVPSTDSGAQRTLRIQPNATGWYRISLRAVDANNQLSDWSDTLITFTGPINWWTENFDTIPNYLVRSGQWSRSTWFSFSEPAAYTDSPAGPYRDRARDTVLLYPHQFEAVIPENDAIRFSYRVAAFLQSGDTALVEYRFGNEPSWTIAAWHNATQEDRWTDTTKAPDAWRFVERILPLRPDTLYIRLRFTSNATRNSDGVWFDDFALSTTTSVPAAEPTILAVVPQPASVRAVIGVRGKAPCNDVEVFTLTGETYRIPWSSSENNVILDVRSLPPGAYFVKLRHGTAVSAATVFVER